MYDDDYTTANSAEKWLSFECWLREKVREMNDKFLQDYSAPWRGEGSPRPPQELYDETVRLSRQKAAGTISIAGFSIGLDENGALTILQSGSHYIIVAAHQVQEFLAALNSLTNAPDPTVVDLNSDTTGWQGPSRTNSQMSMEQNELTLKYLKSKR